MKSMIKTIILLSVFFFLAGGVAIAGKRDPVAVISQVTGKVEYSKNGTKWKKVRSNKFLFDGYQVRSAEKSSGIITNQKSGKSYNLGSKSLVEVSSSGIKAKEGSLNAAEESNQLVAGLMQKFSKSQSYTTVRRSFEKKQLKIDTVRGIVINADHPYLVWGNLGKEYSYKLTIGGTTYDIAASSEPMIKAKIDPFEGTQTYNISVLKGNKVVTVTKPFKSMGEKKDRSITWLSSDSQKEMTQTLEALKTNYPDNSFMLGSYYEEKELWVAAMEQYKKYLKENPDEIEMTPYLFRVYKKLKLNKIYKAELKEFDTAMLE